MPDAKEAVCVNVKRIYDSCADKDCISDLGVLFTTVGQPVIDAASTVRCRDCDVLNCFVDVEEVPFNRGFYSVDITYFFKLTFDAYISPMTPATAVEGLGRFSKKAILYGSDGRVKVFSSEYTQDDFDQQLRMSNGNPVAKVQCVDPICMDAKLIAPTSRVAYTTPVPAIPESIEAQFQGSFTLLEAPVQTVLVTLGLFSIVQLERDVQILIPSYEFAVPCKRCGCDTDDPCDTFNKIDFPVDEFFPPNIGIANGGCCGCGTPVGGCCDDRDKDKK